jgi:hypothetical protein
MPEVLQTKGAAKYFLLEHGCSKLTRNFGKEEPDTLKSSYDIRFEVFTAVTMKNGVFWDVTPCGS